MAEQLGTRYSHFDELCQLAFQRFNATFSTKRLSASLHRCASSTESLVRRSSQSHCSCTMLNVHPAWAWRSVSSPTDQGVQLQSPCPHPSAQKMKNKRKCTLTIGSLSLLTLMRWCCREKPNLREQLLGEPGSGVVCCQGSYTCTEGSETLVSHLRGRPL